MINPQEHPRRLKEALDELAGLVGSRERFFPGGGADNVYRLLIAGQRDAVVDLAAECLDETVQRSPHGVTDRVNRFDAGDCP